MKIRILDVGSANQRFSGGLSNIQNKYIIGFEPDKRTLNNVLQENGKVLPVALSGTNDRRALYLTRKPECSSFYKPNRSYLDLFPNKGRWDIVGEEVFECHTLNSLKNEIGNPDFIKIDTQGSELEILEGGVGEVLDSLLGIECEVEFISIYNDQPLFGDVCKFLKTQGFEFYDFVTEYRYGRKNLDRSGQLAFADALFLRTPEYMFKKFKQGFYSMDKIEKYQIIVNSYGKYDLSEVLGEYIND